MGSGVAVSRTVLFYVQADTVAEGWNGHSGEGRAGGLPGGRSRIFLRTVSGSGRRFNNETCPESKLHTVQEVEEPVRREPGGPGTYCSPGHLLFSNYFRYTAPGAESTLAAFRNNNADPTNSMTKNVFRPNPRDTPDVQEVT